MFRASIGLTKYCQYLLEMEENSSELTNNPLKWLANNRFLMYYSKWKRLGYWSQLQ